MKVVIKKCQIDPEPKRGKKSNGNVSCLLYGLYFSAQWIRCEAEDAFMKTPLTLVTVHKHLKENNQNRDKGRDRSIICA
ncbi:hypothetical protein PDJAM_G00112900 [Pangasius djambal]|uniref:Uncharacterized protein n=1 Tax=Pangasius djambal TaxID=1691987 RepID=A0ACC5Y4K4_9TELE|nr:hypothetical protein [Pangasius djambal]